MKNYEEYLKSKTEKKMQNKLKALVFFPSVLKSQSELEHGPLISLMNYQKQFTFIF